MRIAKLLFTTLFITVTSYCSWGQFYSGVTEVSPYTTKLAKLDIYLQTSPDNLHDLYQELFSIARSKNNKSLEAVLNIYKGTGYYYSGQSDSAVVYFDKAIVIANKIKNNTLLSTAKIRKIFVVGERTDNRIAFGLMKDEYDLAKKNRDTINMIYGLNGMNIFGQEDKDNSKVNANMDAIRLAQDSGNEYEYGFLMNNLGLTKLELGDTEGAIADFNVALAIAKKVENPRLELTVMENVGYYYNEIDSIDLAKKKFQEVYNKAIAISQYHVAVASMVNLGSIHREHGEFEISDSLISRSLDIAKEASMFHFVSLIYLSRAQLNIQMGKYVSAVQDLDSVSVYQMYTPNNAVQIGIYQMNYAMYKKKGDFETALNYYQKFKNFEDSINKNGSLQMISELQLKYDYEKKEKERVQEKINYEKELTEKELSEANLKQRIAIAAILIILLLAVLVIYYFRSKHKRESEFSSALVNKLEEERGKIARDLHDGLGQSLIILKNKFNKIEGGAMGLSEELNTNFTDTIEELRSISRSLIPPELSRLGLQKALIRMLNDVEFSADIVVSMEIDDLQDIELDQPSEIRIYRIIQELTNNTIKHSEATSLKIEIAKQEAGFTIVYQDNGKGLSADNLDVFTNSVGLRSIRQRMKFLNGTVRFEKPPKGFKATIKIKNKK